MHEWSLYRFDHLSMKHIILVFDLNFVYRFDFFVRFLLPTCHVLRGHIARCGQTNFEK